MVKVFEGTDREYYMDGYLKSNLDVALKVNKDDWDFLWIVDGKERSGKSVFAQQLGGYVYPLFSIDCITFTPEQFEKRIKECEPNSVVIYDEAFGGLNSRGSMSKVNRSIVKMLTEIGFKNLFIIIVLPSLFILERYVTLFRARALFHIYTSDDLSRGFFSAYNDESTKRLYLLGKKLMDYKFVKPDFRGRFTNRWMVDKAVYNRKKAMAQEVKNVVDKDDGEVNDLFFDKLMSNPELSHSERIRALGIPESTYFWKLRHYKNENII